jgi:hypothetical protein
MAFSTTRTEDTVSSMFVALIAGTVAVRTNLFLAPQGALGWGLTLAFVTAYVLFANWGLGRLRRTGFFSRLNVWVRFAIVVPTLSLLLLLTVVLAQIALGTFVAE